MMIRSVRRRSHKAEGRTAVRVLPPLEPHRPSAWATGATMRTVCGVIPCCDPADNDRERRRSVRVEHTFTTLSWIPSEAVTGVNKAVFESGFTHYDEPPPDVLYDLDDMAADDRFRFANRLHAWI